LHRGTQRPTQHCGSNRSIQCLAMTSAHWSQDPNISLNIHVSDILHPIVLQYSAQHALVVMLPTLRIYKEKFKQIFKQILLGEWRENQILIPDWTYFHCPSAILIYDHLLLIPNETEIREVGQPKLITSRAKSEQALPAIETMRKQTRVSACKLLLSASSKRIGDPRPLPHNSRLLKIR